MYVWNTVTGVCKKKEEESEEKPTGEVELSDQNKSNSPSNSDKASRDKVNLNDTKIVAGLYEACKTSDFAASAQNISAIAAAVSQLQEAMAEVKAAQVSIFASKGDKSFSLFLILF